MKLSKLKTKDSFVKGTEVWGWHLNLVGCNCIQSKVRRQSNVQLKGIGKGGTKLKLAESQIKKP